MKRVLCVWFPHWPLQRVCFVQPELKGRPVVLYSPARPGGSARRGDWQVVHCARAAVEAGVRPGMPLAEAQSLLERPRAAHFAQHDPQADRKLLELVAGWCSRYSPLVGMEQNDEPSTLFFDVTGCTHLFWGEEPMAEQIVHDFERVGYCVRVALADTPGAAWAVAHFGQSSRHTPCAEGAAVHAERAALNTTADDLVGRAHPTEILGTRSVPATVTVIPFGGQAAALGPLPIAALRLPDKTIDTLYELGIRQVGQLQALPRSSLPARFGPCVLERLDQALGRIEELIIPVPPAEPIEARWSFEEPTGDRRALESVLRRLLGEIAETLAIRQAGAQRLACRLFCTGTEPVCLTIGAVHPTAAAEHLCELIDLQLERITLAGEVLAVEVEVLATGPLETHQQEMFGSGANREGERQLAVLLDRLSSRLGEKAVLRPRLRADPQPEYASHLVTALALNPKSEIPHPKSSFLVPDYCFVSGPAVRPLCLKPRPVPIAVMSIVPDGPPIRFRLADGEHTVCRHWGPERIETAWWREAAVERDYYRVETGTGQRFWLFRQNGTSRWFLHGEFE
ncbi:MAG: DNA polymerase Y family protein [Planctomycetia bacterium]|nr:DNA polymerase Y family protein [Planctomycetia bacterium]